MKKNCFIINSLYIGITPKVIFYFFLFATNFSVILLCSSTQTKANNDIIIVKEKNPTNINTWNKNPNNKKKDFFSNIKIPLVSEKKESQQYPPRFVQKKVHKNNSQFKSLHFSGSQFLRYEKYFSYSKKKEQYLTIKNNVKIKLDSYVIKGTNLSLIGDKQEYIFSDKKITLYYPKKNTTITSGYFLHNRKEKISYFQKEVNLYHKSKDKVLTHLSSDEAQRNHNLKIIYLKNNVKVSHPKFIITSYYGRYHEESQEIFFIKDAVIHTLDENQKEKNIYQADEIKLNQLNNTLSLSGNVQMIITDSSSIKRIIYSDKAKLYYKNPSCKNTSCMFKKGNYSPDYVEKHYKYKAYFTGDKNKVIIKEPHRTIESKQMYAYEDIYNKHIIILQQDIYIIDKKNLIKAYAEKGSYVELEDELYLNIEKAFIPYIIFLNQEQKPILQTQAHKFSWNMSKNKIFAIKEVICFFIKDNHYDFKIIGQFAKTKNDLENIEMTGKPSIVYNKECDNPNCNNKIISKKMNIFTRKSNFELLGNIYGTYFLK